MKNHTVDTKHSRLLFTSHCSGQAIIEFLVAAIVLVPLFLLVPMIGKYLDMKQATIAASRQLAFECTVRYDDCADLNGHPSFADEIRTRFYAGDRAAVLTNDRPVSDAINAGQGNPLWVNRRGEPLLENYADVGIVADAHDIEPGSSVVSSVLEFGPSLFGLELERGLFDARVQVNLSKANGGTSFTDQLDSLAMNMQFHTAILTNAWDASGPGGRSDRCHPERNTVAGRVSEVALCLPPYEVADAAYLIASVAIEDLSGPIQSNSDEFNFHDFIDERWVDRVPTTPDPVGYPRLKQ